MVESLSRNLEKSLSQPPTTAGLRLKSERDLAAMFELDEWQVRKSLDRLVKKGLIVRRRGSGTFVRRVAGLSPELAAATAIDPVESLFTDPIGGVVNTDGRQNDTKLQLGIWTDIQSSSQTSQKILNAIISSVTSRGHRSSINPMTDEFGNLVSAARIQSELQSSNCDGHIVINNWADYFLESVTDSGPVMFFATGNNVVRHEPLVMLNTAEASERGVGILFEQGYERIGYLGLAKREYRLEYKAYCQTLDQLGVPYRGDASPELSHGIGHVMECIRELLGGRERPDAVYVSDDHLLPALMEVCRGLGIQPGRDLGVITLANRGIPLPREYDWSRLEFNINLFGQVIVDNLLWMLQTAGAEPSTLTVHAKWVPGQTHQCHKSAGGA